MSSSPTPLLVCACAGWNVPGLINTELLAQFPSLLQVQDELSSLKNGVHAFSHLERYATLLNGVEINSSFYRSHLPATYARWRQSVPEGFRFSVKLPKTTTHVLRLKNCENELQKFIREASHLKEKLGCLLIQLPPSLPFNAEVARKFFSLLKQLSDTPLALEPRHASWFQAASFDLLLEHDICLVAADPGMAGYEVLQDDFPVTASTSYLRLHGSPKMYYSSYGRVYLEKLRQRIDALSTHSRRIWCVFDNTADGAAFPNAVIMQSLLHVGFSQPQ
ncbi:DUF72 domain-containing protein [Undibacterium sp. Di27W]|uniref:DUF72 domain-containing protein n=1 Tax=Undibacterium sp. Di27W TaxID=3413036 RepID=UPI003BF02959